MRKFQAVTAHPTLAAKSDTWPAALALLPPPGHQDAVLLLIPLKLLCMSVHRCRHTHIHTHTPTQTHTYSHTQIHTHTHKQNTHTHTNTHANHILRFTYTHICTRTQQ